MKTLIFVSALLLLSLSTYASDTDLVTKYLLNNPHVTCINLSFSATRSQDMPLERRFEFFDKRTIMSADSDLTFNDVQDAFLTGLGRKIEIPSLTLNDLGLSQDIWDEIYFASNSMKKRAELLGGTYRSSYNCSVVQICKYDGKAPSPKGTLIRFLLVNSDEHRQGIASNFIDAAYEALKMNEKRSIQEFSEQLDQLNHPFQPILRSTFFYGIDLSKITNNPSDKSLLQLALEAVKNQIATNQKAQGTN
jgi:hypothetical protein